MLCARCVWHRGGGVVRLDWWIQGSAWALYAGILLWLGALDGVPWTTWFGKEPAVGIAQVLSAIGTAAAVVAALWLARASERRAEASALALARVVATRQHTALIRLHHIIGVHCRNIAPGRTARDVHAEFHLINALPRRVERFTDQLIVGLAPLGDRMSRKLALAVSSIEMASEEVGHVLAWSKALPAEIERQFAERMILENSHAACCLLLNQAHALLQEVLDELGHSLRLDAITYPLGKLKPLKWPDAPSSAAATPVPAVNPSPPTAG